MTRWRMPRPYDKTSTRHHQGNIKMILEVAILNIRPGESADFERAFAEAQAIIASMPGYVSHQLLRCLEAPDRYIFLVHWQTP